MYILRVLVVIPITPNTLTSRVSCNMKGPGHFLFLRKRVALCIIFTLNRRRASSSYVHLVPITTNNSDFDTSPLHNFINDTFPGAHLLEEHQVSSYQKMITCAAMDVFVYTVLFDCPCFQMPMLQATRVHLWVGISTYMQEAAAIEIICLLIFSSSILMPLLAVYMWYTAWLDCRVSWV